MNQRIICKGLAVAVIILFLGLAIQPSVAVETDEEIKDKENDNNQYRVFGFLPYLRRGEMYRYWVFPGIQAYLNYWAFEGYVGIIRIKGYSTEQPEYFSPFLSEVIVTKILMMLNLI